MCLQRRVCRAWHQKKKKRRRRRRKKGEGGREGKKKEKNRTKISQIFLFFFLRSA
jgi:hypothetical protein